MGRVGSDTDLGGIGGRVRLLVSGRVGSSRERWGWRGAREAREGQVFEVRSRSGRHA